MSEQGNYSQKLLKREQIPQEYKWKLEDIYSSEEIWEADFRSLKEKIPELTAFQGRLQEGADVLLSCLTLYMEINRLLEKVYVYAHLHKDEDNTVDRYQALHDRAQALSVEISAAGSFLVPEILQIPEERLRQFLDQNESLRLYKFFLGSIIRVKEHILSDKEERILAQAGDVTEGAEIIFSMFNNADLRFPSIRDEEGREYEVTHGKYLQLLENPSRTVRERAFNAVYDTYGEWVNTIAATLNTSVKKDVFYAKMRRYDSALAAALDADNIPLEVYDNLISTIRKNLEPMYRYIRLRRKLLKLPDLHMYDLYTPLVPEYRIEVGYDEALEIVEKGLHPLGREYGEILSKGFRSGWIDVYENIGKTSGAYSSGSYDTHPYVLLNYHPNLHNIFTIAHEMGHAIHSYLSNHTQPYVYAGYRIFVAEVASTVNEILLCDYLVKNSRNPLERMYLLNYYLEQFRGTVYRQTMFAEFEKIIHGKVEAGEPLTPAALKEVYYDLNKAYYGEDIVVDEKIALEWARIPHFYHAFYVYKYATGFSAAVALSQKILNNEPKAVEKYLNFLSSGGKDYPINLLSEAGVDMTKPEPVENALSVFQGVVDELEKLANHNKL